MPLVRYFAAAESAAGLESEHVPATTLGELLDTLRARHGDGMDAVLARCTFLVGGRGATDPGHPLHTGAVVDVLPPFAGG